MKILFDARTTGPDGIGRYVRNLAQSIHNRLVTQPGNSFELITRNYNLKNICGTCNLDDSPHYSEDEIRNKSIIINQRNPDLIHCTDYRTPLENYGVPVVVTIHDIFRYTNPELCYSDDIFRKKYGESVFEEIKNISVLVERKLSSAELASIQKSDSEHFRYYSRMLLWAIKSTSTIITPTNAVKDEINKHFGQQSKIQVIPYGIDHVDRQTETVATLPSISLPAKYILYVGQYRSHKNVDKLIKSFKIALERINDLHLVLVGPDFINNQEIQQFIKSLNIENNVDIFGSLSYENLKYVYEGSYALVHLSRLEGFGLTPLEALSFGTPVIAANNPVLKEVLRDQATYVDPEDINEVAKEIISIISNPHAQDDKNKRVSYAATFTWNRAAEMTIDVYNKMLLENKTHDY